MRTPLPRRLRARFSLSVRAALIACSSLLLLLAQCSRVTQQPPDVLYAAIEQHFMAGQLAEAEILSRPVASHRTDPAWETKFRLQRAKVLFYQGHSAEALALLVPPLPASVPDRAVAAERSSLLALAYDRTGNLAESQRALSESERQCLDELCGELSSAGLRLSQGVIAGENGRLAEAGQAFDSALASARRASNRFFEAQALLNLGVVAERQEHYDDALDRLNQASAVATTIGAQLQLEKATGGIGWAYYKLGDYRRALETSQLAERQAAVLGAHIDQVEWLNNAGLSQFRLGDLGAAKSSYHQSYQLARSLQSDEETADSLVALAYLSLETGDMAGALERARQAQRLAKDDADEALQPMLVEARALAAQGQTASAKDKLLMLEQSSSAVQSDRWEIENALATLYATAGDGAVADAWFRRAIGTFRRQRSSLGNIDSRLPFSENGSTLYLQYMEHLIEEGRADDALGILDQSRADTLAEGLVSDRATDAPHHQLGNSTVSATRHPEAIARRAHGIILVYCLRPHTSYLWAIGPTHTGFFRLPGREVILPLVERHTRAILGAKDILGEQNPPGRALYKLLVEPAASLLEPGRTVFVIAGEGLNGLNFETLVAPDAQPRYWIEDANIIDARSLSLLAESHAARRSGPGDKRLLLVGDPIYNRPDFQPLPHASEEVARVAGHFAGDRRRVLTGAEATPAAYRYNRPGEFAYIHFVAHGTANEIDPLDSSVILSAGSGEPYKLYARDILTQRLDADLVTISACYGSGTRSYSGEGLVGLAWAFLRAGAHKVIGALWDVNDLSTPQLMNDLYAGLASGGTPDVALRSAKLTMIHRGGIFRKPLYWAPFQLYSGD